MSLYPCPIRSAHVWFPCVFVGKRRVIACHFGLAGTTDHCRMALVTHISSIFSAASRLSNSAAQIFSATRVGLLNRSSQRVIELRGWACAFLENSSWIVVSRTSKCSTLNDTLPVTALSNGNTLSYFCSWRTAFDRGFPIVTPEASMWSPRNSCLILRRTTPATVCYQVDASQKFRDQQSYIRELFVSRPFSRAYTLTAHRIT